MKVFLDTNIFLEYFERRREYQAVDKLLSAVEDGKLKAVVSVQNKLDAYRELSKDKRTLLVMVTTNNFGRFYQFYIKPPYL